MRETCLVLLAHGSRNPNWREPFEALLADLRRGAGQDCVHLAYMQLASPSLTDVVEDVTRRGARIIRVLPLLMSAGNHAYEDIPTEVAALREKHPAATIEILPPIGTHPRFMAMLRDLVKESL